MTKDARMTASTTRRQKDDEMKRKRQREIEHLIKYCSTKEGKVERHIYIEPK